jgi:hypothetical protein
MDFASSIDEKSESGCSCQWVGGLTQTAYFIEYMLHLVPLLNQEIIANAWGFLCEVIENALEELRHLFIESVLMR